VSASAADRGGPGGRARRITRGWLRPDRLSITGGRLATWRRRIAYFGAALALVMTMTAVYHLGYPQYREEGIGAPETGNTIISMPMLLSTNPIGSVVDHAAMHISAVVHDYETEVRLPPPAKAD
jgi:hypothetical protein